MLSNIKLCNFPQVLFRYALAILKCVEEKLLRQTDYMSLFSTFKTEVESLADVKELTKVSFTSRRRCREVPHTFQQVCKLNSIVSDCIS